MRSFENIMTKNHGNAIDSTSSDNANTSNNEKKPEKIKSVEKLSKPVYYIESPTDDTVLIGIDVTIGKQEINKEKPLKISWFDTTRERTMLATETRRQDDYFAFKRAEKEGGGFYYFTPMDLKIYNSNVKQRLVAGSDFSNDEDLIDAFLSTKKEQE